MPLTTLGNNHSYPSDRALCAYLPSTQPSNETQLKSYAGIFQEIPEFILFIHKI